MYSLFIRDNVFNQFDIFVDLEQIFKRLKAEKKRSPEQLVSAVDSTLSRSQLNWEKYHSNHIFFYKR